MIDDKITHFISSHLETLILIMCYKVDGNVTCSIQSFFYRNSLYSLSAFVYIVLCFVLQLYEKNHGIDAIYIEG